MGVPRNISLAPMAMATPEKRHSLFIKGECLLAGAATELFHATCALSGGSVEIVRSRRLMLFDPVLHNSGDDGQRRRTW